MNVAAAAWSTAWSRVVVRVRFDLLPWLVLSIILALIPVVLVIALEERDERRREQLLRR